MRPYLALISTFLWLLASSSSQAQSAPWVAAGDIPLPRWAVSVQILERDEPLWSRPSPKARRRGSAAMSARLPLYAARRGPGCQGRWLMVGPVAWVCEDRVRLSRKPPVPVQALPAGYTPLH